jgi:hypothetical protein
MSYVCMIRVFDPSYVSVVVHPLSFLQYLASVSRIVSRYERSNINYMVQIDLIISSISWAYMHWTHKICRVILNLNNFLASLERLIRLF